MALGLVVVYRGTGHLNFAQGEMGTLSAFMAWYFHDKGVPLLLAVLLGMVFGFLLGAATEVAIVRPLARRSLLAVFVATIALFLGINAYTSGVWGAPPDELLDSLFPNDPDDFVRLFGTIWRYQDIGTLAVTLVITGAAVRAVPEDPLRPGDARRGQQRRLGAAGRHPDRPHPRRVVGASPARSARSAAVLVAGNQGQVTPTLMFTVLHLRHRGGRRSAVSTAPAARSSPGC